VIAAGLADIGFDVDLGPLFQTPTEVAEAAVDHDVHLVGISTQAGAHLVLLPKLKSELKRLGSEEILLVAGGIIPEADHLALSQAGVAAVFEPGESVLSAAERLLRLLPEPEGVAGDGD
jgi:methylmalonyl-CoA mutase